MTVKKTIKCYYKICYHKRFDESESAVAKFILEKLGQFKYVYILYFLAEIYHLLAMLLKVFQLKFVDVTIVNNIVHIQITQICMIFIVDSCDLNVDV